MEWQPIETAPKDGMPILLRGDGIYHGIEFVGYLREPIWPWESKHWWDVARRQRVPDHCVEHWMHRTEPPKP